MSGVARKDELVELEASRAAWFAEYHAPRELLCPECARPLGTLFYITWADQVVMDALGDNTFGGVPTQGFFVLVPQGEAPLTALQGRHRYGRLAEAERPSPPAWIGLPGEVACAGCGAAVAIPHPRFPQQARLDVLLKASGKDRRRWRRG